MSAHSGGDDRILIAHEADGQFKIILLPEAIKNLKSSPGEH